MKLGRVRRLVSGFVDGIGIGIAFRICFFVSIGFVSPLREVQLTDEVGVGNW